MNKSTQKIVDQVLKSLEDGVVPWKKPWLSIASKNPFTGTIYSGINRLVLSLEEREPFFATFKQVKAAGGNVIKGSKGYHVCYKSNMRKKDEKTEEEKTIGFLKSYCVFSAADIEGVAFPEIPVYEHEPIKELDELFQSIVAEHSVNVLESRDRACFIPSTDEVKLPQKKHFDVTEEYYSTMFHELAHWTGGKDRLDRDMTGSFGSNSYGKEELVAEITSSIVLQSKGMIPILENSKSYISSWYKTIKANPQILITAASQAEKAAAFLLGEVKDECA